MPSLSVRIDRLEQVNLSGYQAAIRALPYDALLDAVKGWDLGTWAAVLGQADPGELESFVAIMRDIGPGTR